MSEVLVEVNKLTKQFRVDRKNILKAVDDISFQIHRGETFGLVGESGCGKTTLGRTILRLYDTNEGSIKFNGEDISRSRGKKLIEFKKNAQIIFQDPYASLDPRMTIGEIISEGLEVHFQLSKKELYEKAVEILKKVGMGYDYINRYAHELSGGQRQRVGIARALAVEPKFIVCDEPISALDVSIQAQIINLLINLQQEYGLTYLFISHDLSMIRYISDRIGVMYLGSFVEVGSSEEIFNKPMHPYTKALISAIPVPDPDSGEESSRIKLIGEIPSNLNEIRGCKFSQRCIYSCEKCGLEKPPLIEVEKNHYVACHLVSRSEKLK